MCTCPDIDSARAVAGRLVAAGLAACVNRISGMESTYRWQGEVVTAEEQLLLIKTRSDRFDAVREAIEAVHPDELPEIIAINMAAGSDRYLNWINASVESE